MLQKIFFTTFVLFLFASLSVQAGGKEGIEFFHGSWDELQREAKKKDMPFFIDFWASWCGPCKMLNNTTFRDKEVGTVANTYFIPYKMDVDQPEGKMLSGKYNISSIPTIVFFNAKGSEIGRVSGYRNAQQFIEEMNKYMSKADARDLKKSGKDDSAPVSFESYWAAKQGDIKAVEGQLFANDSLRALMAEARQLGGRKEDLLLENLYSRATAAGLEDKKWLLNVAYRIGAKDYKTLASELHVRYQNREFDNMTLHWLCLQFVDADIEDVPNEPMQWINALVRNTHQADCLDTKAALLYRDKKYEYAVEVSREAQKAAVKQNYSPQGSEILEQLAQKGS